MDCIQTAMYIHDLGLLNIFYWQGLTFRPEARWLERGEIGLDVVASQRDVMIEKEVKAL